MSDSSSIIGIIGFLLVLGVSFSQAFIIDWKIRQIEKRINSMSSDQKRLRRDLAEELENHGEDA